MEEFNFVRVLAPLSVLACACIFRIGGGRRTSPLPSPAVVQSRGSSIIRARATVTVNAAQSMAAAAAMERCRAGRHPEEDARR